MLGFPPAGSIQWKLALSRNFKFEAFYVTCTVRDADCSGDVAAYSRARDAYFRMRDAYSRMRYADSRVRYAYSKVRDAYSRVRDAYPPVSA